LTVSRCLHRIISCRSKLYHFNGCLGEHGEYRASSWILNRNKSKHAPYTDAEDALN